jgi:hypothetical protein
VDLPQQKRKKNATYLIAATRLVLRMRCTLILTRFPANGWLVAAFFLRIRRTFRSSSAGRSADRRVPPIRCASLDVATRASRRLPGAFFLSAAGAAPLLPSSSMETTPPVNNVLTTCITLPFRTIRQL